MLNLVMNKLISMVLNFAMEALLDWFEQLKKDKATKKALERAANEGNTSDIELITRSL